MTRKMSPQTPLGTDLNIPLFLKYVLKYVIKSFAFLRTFMEALNDFSEVKIPASSFNSNMEFVSTIAANCIYGLNLG